MNACKKIAAPQQDFLGQTSKHDVEPAQDFQARLHTKIPAPDSKPSMNACKNFAAPQQDFLGQTSKPIRNNFKNISAPQQDFFANHFDCDLTPAQNFYVPRQEIFTPYAAQTFAHAIDSRLDNFSVLKRQFFHPPKSATPRRNVYVPLSETGWQENLDASRNKLPLQHTLPGIVFETKDQNLPPVGPLETLASFWRGPET